jgi:hypothetical protein
MLKPQHQELVVPIVMPSSENAIWDPGKDYFLTISNIPFFLGMCLTSIASLHELKFTFNQINLVLFKPWLQAQTRVTSKK